jgi:hypothetical protein
MGQDYHIVGIKSREHFFLKIGSYEFLSHSFLPTPDPVPSRPNKISVVQLVQLVLYWCNWCN